MTIALSIVSLVFAVAVLVYAVHVAVVFQRFNDGIKDWAQSLDASTQEAINRSARNILRELDARISEVNNKQENIGQDEEKVPDVEVSQSETE